MNPLQTSSTYPHIQSTNRGKVKQCCYFETMLFFLPLTSDLSPESIFPHIWDNQISFFLVYNKSFIRVHDKRATLNGRGLYTYKKNAVRKILPGVGSVQRMVSDSSRGWLREKMESWVYLRSAVHCRIVCGPKTTRDEWSLHVSNCSFHSRRRRHCWWEKPYYPAIQDTYFLAFQGFFIIFRSTTPKPSRFPKAKLLFYASKSAEKTSQGYFSITASSSVGRPSPGNHTNSFCNSSIMFTRCTCRCVHHNFRNVWDCTGCFPYQKIWTTATPHTVRAGLWIDSFWNWFACCHNHWMRVHGIRRPSCSFWVPRGTSRLQH